MEHIRPACRQDLPYLYDIALKTAHAGKDATEYFYDKFCVGHYYAAPYLFFEPQLCFVALNAEKRPCGYIVGTSNTEAFNKWMNTTWLPPLQAQYEFADRCKSEDERRIIQLLVKGPGAGVWEYLGYPAHLHIDLLPELQGKGIGRGLISTFFETAAAMGIPGVHLGVGGKNAHAAGFYRAMGMELLETKEWGTYFGKRFATPNQDPI